jgi:hypothetical protein
MGSARDSEPNLPNEFVADERFSDDLCISNHFLGGAVAKLAAAQAGVVRDQ